MELIVTNNGASYTTYHNMAKKMGLTNYPDRTPRNNKQYEIIAEGRHESTDLKLYGISDGHEQFIIGKEGIKLIEHEEDGEL